MRSATLSSLLLLLLLFITLYRVNFAIVIIRSGCILSGHAISPPAEKDPVLDRSVQRFHRNRVRILPPFFLFCTLFLRSNFACRMLIIIMMIIMMMVIIIITTTRTRQADLSAG